MPVIVSLHLTHHKQKVILQARIRLGLKERRSVFQRAFLEVIGETLKGTGYHRFHVGTDSILPIL